MARRDVPLRSAEFEARLVVSDPDPWSPENANIYDLAVEIEHDGRLVDAAERTIGFRRFEARDGRPLLNGEPFARAKAMGLNTLRCHVKIPDRLYFDLAYRLGLIVRLDMPYMQFLVRRRAGRSGECSERRSGPMAIIPRSRSGRSSTRDGELISTTTQTTGVG